MLINGKERHFLLTVGSLFDIARACPEGDITKLGDMLDNGETKLRISLKMAVAMNKAYNDRQKWRGLEAEDGNLTEEELLFLPVSAFVPLTQEVTKAYLDGMREEIELKDSKKKED